jgi:peptidyl-prolyl cis-trans isomerase C
MKNMNYLRLLAVIVSAAVLPASAQNLAIVNGKAIPSSRVEAMVKQMVQQGQKDSPEMRSMIKEELINREILAQEADRQGVSSRPEIKNQVDLARQSIVIRALAQEFMAKHPVKEEEMKAEYDKFKSQSQGKEYHARHILVEKRRRGQSDHHQAQRGWQV